jgi:drug/metabolite transporter (DMT)-like permease
MNSRALTSSRKRLQAGLELSTAGAIWGFGFVAAVWILPFVGPIWISGLRFAVSSAVVGLAALLFPRLRAQFSREDFRASMLPGFAIASMMILQTVGLRFTTATNSGFITTLYVVLVPLIQSVFFGKRVSVWTFSLILVAFVGTALIANLHAGAWNIGDLFTLGCALLAAVHILMIDRFAAKATSPLSLNTFQSFWGALLCLPLAIWLEPAPSLRAPAIAWLGLGFLTFVSTMGAFLIQIRAQRVLSPVTASLLFLLESPFSAVFAYFLLREQLSAEQWAGGVMILVAAALCVLRPDAQKSAPT